MDDSVPLTDYSLTDYSEDGIDLTLIRWMLSLTPAERLSLLEQHVNSILEVWKELGINPLARAAGVE